MKLILQSMIWEMSNMATEEESKQNLKENIEWAITTTKEKIKRDEYELAFWGLQTDNQIEKYKELMDSVETHEKLLSRLRLMNQKYFGITNK